MLQAFSDLAKNVKLKAKAVYVDNLVFQLHYRLTFWILLTCVVLVSSRQYIGEHIRCISDTIAGNVINTFCFFTTTFTVVRHLNGTSAPHPGVGPLQYGMNGESDEPTIRHAYYQWVPFVLSGQAIMFYLPHLLWRTVEGGTIKTLVHGLEHAYLALRDSEFSVSSGKVLSKNSYRKKIVQVRDTFLTRLDLNKYWGYKLMLCEVLNASNLLIQFLLTDAFLGGRFMGLGSAVMDPEQESDPLDIVFPKVTKCLFRKYGPSGTIQKHDAMCVMALNIINEKIYTFLWFWFVFLTALTVAGLLWRVLTILVLSRNLRFSQMLFRTHGRVDPTSFRTVMRHCEFSNWLFLYYLTKNMHGWATNDLFKDLASEMDEMDKRRGVNPDGSTGSSAGFSDETLPLKPLGLHSIIDEPDASINHTEQRPHIE